MTEDLKKTTLSKDTFNTIRQQLQACEQQLKATNQRLNYEIAERKRIEEALEASNKELRDFIYIISHDLREPLRKISSFGMLLQDSFGSKLEKEDRENLEFMIDGARRMTQMIEALLAYSRINTKAPALEIVDLNETIKKLEQLELATMLEENGGTIEIPQLLPEVLADPDLIKKLLQNLIINGIKYRREGIQPQILIIAERVSEDAVKIELQDNGIGIEKEHNERIFKMFARLHSRQENEGPGAGLAICKKIVEKHGGRIGIESKVGVGSTFWFTLPTSKSSKQEQGKLISSLQA